MKKVLLVSSYITLALVGGTTIDLNKELFAQSDAFVEHKLTKIPSLSLPVPGQAGADHINFKVNAPLNNLPNTAPVLKLVNANITESNVQDIAKKLGMIGTVKENTQLNALILESGAKYLEVQKESGKILYLNREHFNQKEVNGTLKSIPTDDESIKYATEFLKSMNWLPANFRVAGVTENREVPGNLNAEVNKGFVLSKSVHFYQYIDNKPVLGVSRIIVEVGNNGEIEAVRKYHKANTNFTNYPVNPVNIAIDELQNNKGIHTIEEGGVNPVINKVDITYWEDAGAISEQPYLQPVYVFEGTYSINRSIL